MCRHRNNFQFNDLPRREKDTHKFSELKDNTVFRTRLYEYRGDPEHAGRRYAVVQIVVDEDVAPLGYQGLYLRLLKRAVKPGSGPIVRAYVHRDPANDRRAENRTPFHEARRGERRVGLCVQLEESFTYVQDGRIVEQEVNEEIRAFGFEPVAGQSAKLARDTR